MTRDVLTNGGVLLQKGDILTGDVLTLRTFWLWDVSTMGRFDWIPMSWQFSGLRWQWMCGVTVTDRFSCSELRDRLEIDDIITVIQRRRLRWYGHVLRKDEEEWVTMHGLWGERCTTYRPRPGGRPKKTWSEERLSDPTTMQERCYGP